MTPPRSSKKRLTHVDERGAVRMVAVDAKAATHRSATARATIRCSKEAIDAISSAKKGDVLATVRIASIQGAKRTSELVPLCHPLPLTHVAAEIGVFSGRVTVTCRAETVGPTGVEMEALTGASIGALAFYDMLKAVDRGMTYEVELLEKTGGASGPYRRGKSA